MRSSRDLKWWKLESLCTYVRSLKRTGFSRAVEVVNATRLFFCLKTITKMFKGIPMADAQVVVEVLRRIHEPLRIIFLNWTHYNLSGNKIHYF